MEKLEPPHKSLVVYDTDPEVLVQKIIALLEIEDNDLKQDMMRDDHWFIEKPNHEHNG
jgi:hypothetical protein